MSTPNTWATATVKNDWGGPISNVRLHHRYDNDHYDGGTWGSLASGASGAAFSVGYWTGAGRTGADFWLVQFEAGGQVWSCKDSFDCTLTKSDAGKLVVCRVYQQDGKAKMDVICPGSSDCTVSLSPLPDNTTPYSRPVYIIGHRCNDVEDIGLAVSRGCNAIECDLQYDAKKNTLYVNHDYKTGYKLSEWLDGARRIADIYPEHFALIVFDSKFAADGDLSLEQRKDAMLAARRLVREKLSDGVAKPIYTVFSVASYDDREVLSKILTDLKSSEGVAIDQSSQPETVQSYFTEQKVVNGFYGNGIMSMIPDWNLRHTLAQGASLRDDQGVFKKVYVWTLASEASIDWYLNLSKVDGVMVNVPGTITANPGFANGVEQAWKVVHALPHTRLAGRSDLAFAVHLKVTLSWPTPAPVRYGQPLGPAHFRAIARGQVGSRQIELKGKLTYKWNGQEVAAGQVLPGGDHTLTVDFYPDDPLYFRPASGSVQVRVLRATPKIAWAQPEAIVFGDRLSDQQLNASATALVGGVEVPVKGKFSYYHGDQLIELGDKLPAGLLTLTARFEPDEASNFNPAAGSVQLRVWLATHVFTKYEAGSEETFSHLALKHYGHATPYYWQWIIDHNKGIIPANYKRTRAGTKVYIPEVPPPPAGS